jgi:hypothetical protein
MVTLIKPISVEVMKFSGGEKTFELQQLIGFGLKPIHWVDSISNKTCGICINDSGFINLIDIELIKVGTTDKIELI